MRIFALAFALLALCANAEAQPSRTGPNIAGTWRFEAPLDPDGDCTISGDATIVARPRESGVYDVHTIGEERCPDGGWKSEQQCVGRQDGQSLVILCEIIRAEPSNYYSDNFTLEIGGRDLMSGRLLSSRNGTAVWRRSRALVS